MNKGLYNVMCASKVVAWKDLERKMDREKKTHANLAIAKTKCTILSLKIQHSIQVRI